MPEKLSKNAQSQSNLSGHLFYRGAPKTSKNKRTILRTIPFHSGNKPFFWRLYRKGVAIHACLTKPLRRLGNGRNTVSRVLFRKRELTEFCGKLGEFWEKLGEFALATQIKGWKELTEFAPRNTVSPNKTHWARCLKPCSPKLYSARFRNTPKGPFRTKNSMESKFTTAREKCYGNSKTLRENFQKCLLFWEKEAGKRYR